MKRKWFKWRNVSIALLSAITLTVPTAILTVSCSSNNDSNSSSPSTPPSSGEDISGNPSTPAVKHLDLSTQKQDPSNVHVNSNEFIYNVLQREKKIWDTQHVLWFENDKPITYTFSFEVRNWHPIVWNTKNKNVTLNWGDFSGMKFDVTPKSGTTQATFDNLSMLDNYGKEYESKLDVVSKQKCKIDIDPTQNPKDIYSTLSTNQEQIPILQPENAQSGFIMTLVPDYRVGDFTFGILDEYFSVNNDKKLVNFTSEITAGSTSKWLICHGLNDVNTLELTWTITKSTN